MWRVYLAHSSVAVHVGVCILAFLPAEGEVFEGISPVKAQTQVQFIAMQVAVLHLCMVWLSLQVKLLHKICQLCFCDAVNSTVSVLWSRSKETKSKA